MAQRKQPQQIQKKQTLPQKLKQQIRDENIEQSDSSFITNSEPDESDIQFDNQEQPLVGGQKRQLSQLYQQIKNVSGKSKIEQFKHPQKKFKKNKEVVHMIFDDLLYRCIEFLNDRKGNDQFNLSPLFEKMHLIRDQGIVNEMKQLFGYQLNNVHFNMVGLYLPQGQWCSFEKTLYLQVAHIPSDDIEYPQIKTFFKISWDEQVIRPTEKYKLYGKEQTFDELPSLKLMLDVLKQTYTV